MFCSDWNQHTKQLIDGKAQRQWAIKDNLKWFEIAENAIFCSAIFTYLYRSDSVAKLCAERDLSKKTEHFSGTAGYSLWSICISAITMAQRFQLISSRFHWLELIAASIDQSYQCELSKCFRLSCLSVSLNGRHLSVNAQRTYQKSGETFSTIRPFHLDVLYNKNPSIRKKNLILRFL